MKNYNKPTTTIDEKIHILKSGGMLFEDTNNAKKFLELVDYYRLGHYWKKLFVEKNGYIQDKSNSQVKHDKFYDRTRFSHIVDLYNFNEYLSIHLFKAIREFEISLRAQLSYCLAQEGGSHAHLDKSIFYRAKNSNIDYHDKNIAELIHKLSRKDSVNSLCKRYSERLPPIWATVEIMDFSDLSKWYKTIYSKNKAKLNISSYYGIDDPDIFASWIFNLSSVRNNIAHHDYLLNDKKFPKIKYGTLSYFNNVEIDKISATIVILDYFMKTTFNNEDWRLELKNRTDTISKNLDLSFLPPTKPQTLEILLGFKNSKLTLI